VFIVILNGRIYAAWVGAEGDNWLKWDTKTRQVYVEAYVLGMQSGFTRGCSEGIFAAQPKIKGGDATKYANVCLAHSPISEKDSIKMIDAITEFYTKYPKQRYLYISDILLRLHAGLSIEQIHEHFEGTQH
jgi:hypothetical protein